MVARKRMRKQVEVDWTCMKSIKKAERMKTMLENKGYNLKGTKSVGGKNVLEYEK